MNVSETYVVPDEVRSSILRECFAFPTGPAALRRLCDFVGGRISGTERGHEAELWGVQEFARIGVERVWTESFEVPVWERGDSNVEVVGRTGWRMHALAHGMTPERCELTAPLVDGGHGVQEDYERLGDLAQGAVILCDEGAPAGKRVPHRTEKLLWAVEHGAAGLLIGSNAPGCLPRTGVCHRSGAPIPSLGIASEDRARVLRLLEDGVRPLVHVGMANRLSRGTAQNVIAELEGTEAGSGIVLAGAHLDSWDVAQGATDNGLGCAIVLQAAAALARLAFRPRRTIRFALWAAEETGLRGSRHYVRTHEADLDGIVAVMNFDMTGDPTGFWTPGRPEGHPTLKALARELAPLGMREDVHAQPSLHSDHQPFMLEGVPIVGLVGFLPEGGGGHYYHSAGDTFEKVSIPALCRAAAVAAHALWVLADAPESLFGRQSAEEVQDMLGNADLLEAVAAEGDA